MNKIKLFTSIFLSVVFVTTNTSMTNYIFAQEEDTVAQEANQITDKKETSASEYTENDIVYNLDKKDKTASVVKAKNYNIEKIVIPEKIKGYSVTKIEERAFGEAEYKKFETIILPDSVVELGEKAFNVCYNLKTVKLSKNLKRIGDACFQYCCNLKKIDIPDSVNYIGESAFNGCVSLKKVNIPKSLSELNEDLFSHCIALNKIDIHKNIKKIDKNTFSRCSINLNLKDTKIDKDNPIYKKQDNYIVTKKDGSKVIEFAIKDKIYKEKLEKSKELYKKMEAFLKEQENCKLEDFDEVCKEYMKKISKPQKILTKEEFENASKGKILLYRGVSKPEYIDDFKQRKIFFSDNMISEKGIGTYITPEYEQAEMWIFSYNDQEVKKLEEYAENHPEILNDKRLLQEIQKKFLSHGGIITMFMDEQSRIINSDYLDSCVDLMYKLHPKNFKDIAFNGHTYTQDILSKLKIYQDKRNKLMHNFGVLARFLGYDAIYTRETQLIIDEDGTIGSEYLVVNPEVLNVLND